MRIEYYEKDGRIGVRYVFGISAEEHETLRNEFDRERRIRPPLKTDLGFIPVEIQEKGPESILAYAMEICRNHVARREENARRRIRDREERKMNVNEPVSALHESGTILRGRIRYKSPGAVSVTLEHPFQTASDITFDYPRSQGESMSGLRVFRSDGSLTDCVKRDAKRALIKIYDKEMCRRKHGDVIDLVDHLNELGIP